MAINRAASRNIQWKITKKVNASHSVQRKATSSDDYEEEFSSTSRLAEELEQIADALLLDLDVRQSQYAGSSSRRRRRRK